MLRLQKRRFEGRPYERRQAMNCQQARTMLELATLGELDELSTRRLDRHVADCQACRKERDVLRSAASLIRDGQVSPILDSNTMQRMHSALDTELREQRWRISRSDRRRPLITAAAAAVLVVSGLSFIVAKSLFFPSGSSPVPASAVLWQLHGTRSMETSSACAPTVAAGMAYVPSTGDSGDIVRAVRLADGAQIWQSRMQTRGYLAADAHRVYAVSADDATEGALAALSTESGAVVWRFTPPRSGSPTVPVVADNLVMWTSGSSCHAVSARNGAEAWSYGANSPAPLSAPAVHAGAVYVVDHGDIVCLSAVDGHEQWRDRIETAPSMLLRPHITVDGTRAYVAQRSAEMQGVVTCIDLDKRRLAWRRDDIGATQVHACDGRVFARGHGVHALDPVTGRALWSHDAAGCSPVLCVGERLVFSDATQPKALTVLDAADGGLVHHLSLPNACAGFVLAGGIGLINANDGVLRAIRTRETMSDHRSS
ncbi:MAG: PQQ-binding-like beta-propeller repeat protein [Chitinivibrionales bacterium]|nr:PQQ-binding-like beta-propeller repeat protein [Chitinivibrionales bacterium]